MDIAKRLLDYGFHAPTVYFPLVVPEALMIEPTETESKETLDAFAEVLGEIWPSRRGSRDARNAPYTTPVSRPDEVRAAKPPVIRQALPARARAAGVEALADMRGKAGIHRR